MKTASCAHVSMVSVYGQALLPADADISRTGPLPPVAVALVRRSWPSHCLLDDTRLTAEQIRSVDLIIEETPYTEHAKGPRNKFPEGDIDVTVTTLGKYQEDGIAEIRYVSGR